MSGALISSGTVDTDKAAIKDFMPCSRRLATCLEIQSMRDFFPCIASLTGLLGHFVRRPYGRDTHTPGNRNWALNPPRNTGRAALQPLLWVDDALSGNFRWSSEKIREERGVLHTPASSVCSPGSAVHTWVLASACTAAISHLSVPASVHQPPGGCHWSQHPAKPRTAILSKPTPNPA